jgi:hypothetical protein
MENWTEPVLISEGAVGKKSVEYPWLGASVGNQLNVVYEDDFQRVWYTSHLTDAPALASKKIPALVALLIRTPTRLFPSPSPSTLPDSSNAIDPVWVGYPLAVSSASVTLLILAVLVVRLGNFRRH